MAKKKRKAEVKPEINHDYASMKAANLFAVKAKAWGLPAQGKWWVYHRPLERDFSSVVKTGFASEAAAQKWIKNITRR